MGTKQNVKKMIKKLLSAVIGFVFPILFFLPFIILLVVARSVYLIKRIRKIDYYSKYKEGYHIYHSYRSGKKKLIDLEFSWLKLNAAHWELKFDGDGEQGHEIKLSYWLLGQYYISLYNFGRHEWYPKWDTQYGRKPWGEKTYGFAIHHWNTWLMWSYDQSGYTGNSGMICFDPGRLIRGSGRFERRYIDFKTYDLQFKEGVRPVVVIKQEQRTYYPRWFTHKHIAFDVIPGRWVKYIGQQVEYDHILVKSDHPDGKYYSDLDGYYKVMHLDHLEEGSVITPDYVIDNEPIPIPGKGTTAYNCEDTATSSFYIGTVDNHLDAAMKAFSDTIKTRIVYGGQNWPSGV